MGDVIGALVFAAWVGSGVGFALAKWTDGKLRGEAVVMTAFFAVTMIGWLALALGG